MSTPFYDLASLVVAPSGYKTSKVYAQKPLTTDGQLTFSRASAATRVNSAGLIEKVRTNLFQFSEQLSNAYWGKTASGTALAPVITENFAPAPDGSNTAERAYFNAVGTLSTDRSGLVRQLAFTTGQTYTISVYAKSATGANQILQFRLCGSQVGSEKTVTNNWQRFTETFTATTSITDDFGIQIRGNNSVNTSDLILWGFQLELSDVMTDYIATTSAAVSVGPVANVPRLDYLNSSCPRLLLEPQRTNLVTYSEQLDNAAWTKTNATITANSIVSPDGNTNADLITTITTGDLVQQSFTLTSGTSYTGSFFLKAGTGTSIAILYSGAAFSAAQTVSFDLTTKQGTATSGTPTFTITDFGNGWLRCTITATATSTNTGNFRVASLSLDAVSTFYAWGAQLEAGAYATSYIPTLGSASTRASDACSKTGISSLIGQTEGTLFIDMEFEGYDNLFKWIAFLGAGSSYIGFYTDNTSKFIAEVVIGGIAQFSSVTFTFAVGQRYKLALAYKENDFAFYVNGTQVATDNSGTVPATSQFSFEYNTTANNLTARTYNQVLLFKTRLTNAQLAELTTL